jgi:heme-degrading monooxygenase HmoA
VIARSWTGVCADGPGAERYARHFAADVMPALESVAGHRGALLLRRGVEVRVVTFWSSPDAIAGFAGAEPDRAVVEPAARAVLEEYDERVEHFEVVIDTIRPGGTA